ARESNPEQAFHALAEHRSPDASLYVEAAAFPRYEAGHSKARQMIDSRAVGGEDQLTGVAPIQQVAGGCARAEHVFQISERARTIMFDKFAYLTNALASKQYNSHPDLHTTKLDELEFTVEGRRESIESRH